MQPVLTAVESAVMHIISADTIEADTILSIRYTQHRFWYDNDPIIVRFLIWTVSRSFSTRLIGYKTTLSGTIKTETDCKRQFLLKTDRKSKSGNRHSTRSTATKVAICVKFFKLYCKNEVRNYEMMLFLILCTRPHCVVDDCVIRMQWPDGVSASEK